MPRDGRKRKAKATTGSPRKKTRAEEGAVAGPTDHLHRRTLRLAISVAAQRLFPRNRLVGGHAVGKGYWYRMLPATNAVEGAKGPQDVSVGVCVHTYPPPNGKASSEHTRPQAAKAGHVPRVAPASIEESLQEPPLCVEDCNRIRDEVQNLIKRKEKIVVATIPFTEAVKALKAQQQHFAVRLLESHVEPNIPIVKVGNDVLRLSHFPLHPTFGQLATGPPVVLCAAPGGFIVSYAKNGDYVEQPGLVRALADHRLWNNTNLVNSVGDLNTLGIAERGKGRIKLMLAAEFRQEQLIADIARELRTRAESKDQETIRVLCIAGPTASGKTTFAHKLSMYLSNYGFHAKPLTVDHYYKDLLDQPKYKLRKRMQDVDFDHIESMDIDLVAKHVKELVDGRTVEVPKYDFASGRRAEQGIPFCLDGNRSILIMEGIHALNPDYTSRVSRGCVFKVYISPLTSLQVDDFNAIKTTNHRLLRRLCRDYLFRGHPPERTLRVWPKVRAGEGTYIFGRVNDADALMNSAMEYELAVLKTLVGPVLHTVPPSSPEFAKAREVLDQLRYVATWPAAEVPTTSLLREFIGGGSFDCH